MEDLPHNLEVEVEVKLLKDGKVILDKLTADLLRALSVTGSLLAAAKSVEVPYSRAWRAITSLERKIGHPVITPRRGGRYGGGSSLTDVGRELLAYYTKVERKFAPKVRDLTIKGFERPDLAVMGSHDFLLEEILKDLARRGFRVEEHWIGSYGGFLSLMIGDADVAGTHLLDPATMQYNIPIVKEMFPEGVVLIRGYDREVGWVYRRGKGFKEEDLVRGKLVLANRNKGSGTRILIDRLLSDLASKVGLGYSELRKMIKGYEHEYPTHTAVCRAVAEGKADVTIAIRSVAELYGLEFKRICWERYDFAVREESLERDAVSEFVNLISKRELSRRASSMEGYRIPEDTGRRLI